MSTRSRKNHFIYEKYTKQKQAEKKCDFCEFSTKSTQIISDHKYFWIVKNIFAYDLWDNCGVLDHLLVVPKRHTDTLLDLKQAEQIEYMNLVAEYESKGYSLYARAPNNVRKSVVHQHSHLIKLDNKPKKTVLFNKKPNILISR